MVWLKIRPKTSELVKCFECFKVHPSLTEDRVGSFLQIYWKSFAKVGMKTESTMEMCSEQLHFPGCGGNSAQGREHIYKER